MSSVPRQLQRVKNVAPIALKIQSSTVAEREGIACPWLTLAADEAWGIGIVPRLEKWEPC